ncbi:MAG: glycoside hydrolase family 38 C-terminal domain-containing protein, partial [Streptomycetales bacterium]
MPPEIVAVESTCLFAGTEHAPRQVVRVSLRTTGGQAGLRASVHVAGPGVTTPEPARVAVPAGGEPVTAEVAVLAAGAVGDRLPVDATATTEHGQAAGRGQLEIAEPGWTMYMVSHFHYDPFWWNTQAAYTSEWDALDWEGSPRSAFQGAGFALVRAHLDMARRDPLYKFVLAEVDYLKPYWDSHPEDRRYLRQLLHEERLELMGGTYNEPNTNLTSAESTARNAVYGIGFQRHVMGGDPATAWQLDAFGHDPQFPGMMADAGLTSSSWARGPFHQWGPTLRGPADRSPGDARVMQFPSEFEWLSPSGRGLLTSYMPNHYSAGWWMDSAPTLAEAQEQTYRLFLGLMPVAATRNVLLPVGTDYSPPGKWVTEIHRDWNARYVWPRFVCALPREFFAAVRAELAQRGVAPLPQTRDMNPVYTGKDVSYIDTKQAQRDAENTVLDAEKFATLAGLTGAGGYPQAALDKAWRQLVFGAHHDGITGSESDQVYLDLLGGWREAYELSRDVHDRALNAIAERVDTSGEGRAIVVFNALSWTRSDLVTARVELPEPGVAGLAVLDDAGARLPALLEGLTRHEDASLASASVSFLARDVPSVGYRTFRLVAQDRPAPAGSWESDPGATTITNRRYRVEVDPHRGGGLSSIVARDTGRELLDGARVGNELLVYEEYPAHPDFHEGPWHLVPSGAVTGAAERPADSVHVERCALGERLAVTGQVGGLTYTQTVTLWEGVDRIECVTRIDEFAGADQLLRVRFPCAIRGALPVSEVGNAVVGRGFALPDVDSATAPWTLDNPAHHWFALSSTARVGLRGSAGAPAGTRAFGIAEIICPDGAAPGAGAARSVRELAVALVRAGVTSTCSTGAGSRYGALDVDSNLPDVRIAVGRPDQNAFTAQVLDAAAPGYAAELERQLAATGRARLWVPADRELTEVWVPNADLRGPLDLPVLVLAGADADATAAEVAGVAGDLADTEIEVRQPEELCRTGPFDDHTVALLNRGVPGFAVDPSGALHLSLMRSCTGWPSGVWIDPPKRTAPDGAGFQLQHWTHTFGYALVAGPGDWRATGLVRAGYAFNHPLRGVVTGGREGRLPPAQAMVTAQPSDRLVLTALKPTGNALAHGSRQEADPRRSITLRCYEAHGSPAGTRIGTAWRARE